MHSVKLLDIAIVIIIIMATSAGAKQKAFAEKAASSTSFYTDEEKKDSYFTLPQVLESKCSDPLVRQVINDLMQVCADITDALRVALVTVNNSTNDFGDTQLSVDVRFAFCGDYEK
jgi:hypothetical protein